MKGLNLDIFINMNFYKLIYFSIDLWYNLYENFYLTLFPIFMKTVANNFN